IQVDEAGDGVEALEQLDGKSYGLVITDYRMPRLNGLALIAILQKTRQGLPILFLAGTLDSAEEHCARTYGAFSILRKPVSHAVLLDTVWAAVRSTPSLSVPLH
ncbi:MAG: response regulator, partial [bacterium]